MKNLHIGLDDARRKRSMDGMVYAVQPTEVIDMMRRYDVAVIQESNYKPFIPYIPFLLKNEGYVGFENTLPILISIPFPIELSQVHSSKFDMLEKGSCRFIFDSYLHG